jgi:hypothetical protein
MPFDHKTIDYEFLVNVINNYTTFEYSLDEHIKTEILKKYRESYIHEINEKWNEIRSILVSLSPKYRGYLQGTLPKYSLKALAELKVIADMEQISLNSKNKCKNEVYIPLKFNKKAKELAKELQKLKNA